VLFRSPSKTPVAAVPETLFTKLGAKAIAGGKAHSVDISYNAGHPGVAEPHYHITVWHVDPATAKLK